MTILTILSQTPLEFPHLFPELLGFLACRGESCLQIPDPLQQGVDQHQHCCPPILQLLFRKRPPTHPIKLQGTSQLRKTPIEISSNPIQT